MSAARTRRGRVIRGLVPGARAVLAGRDAGELAPVAAWRAAYQAFGAKPKRTRPSVEALLRRVEAGLPRIDRLTDIYNAISVRHLLPVGGEGGVHTRNQFHLSRCGTSVGFDFAGCFRPLGKTRTPQFRHDLRNPNFPPHSERI